MSAEHTEEPVATRYEQINMDDSFSHLFSYFCHMSAIFSIFIYAFNTTILFSLQFILRNKLLSHFIRECTEKIAIWQSEILESKSAESTPAGSYRGRRILVNSISTESIVLMYIWPGASWVRFEASGKWRSLGRGLDAVFVLQESSHAFLELERCRLLISPI